MFQQNFFRIIIIFFTLNVLFVSCATKKDKSEVSDVDWSKMYQIINNVKEPVFKNKVYLVTDFGAVADGSFDNTLVFKKAIQSCSQNGGGIVSVPFGKYFTGPIHLEDNVNFHLEDGAEVLFSTNPKDYPIVHTSFEGMELMNYSPLIYAYNKKNVAVTGKGVLNGQANETNWWPWKGSTSEGSFYGFKEGQPSQKDKLNLPALMDMAQTDVPVEKRVFGEGHYLRPNFFEPFGCTNVLIKDVKIINAPFWVLHPMKSTNVIVDGVTVQSHGPNNDGCDPEYSKNVIIKNCIFNTGDDCIAIKAGRDNEGRKVGIKSENIVVQKCKMIDGHGGVVIGSEMSAGVQNVFVEDCKMDSPNLDRVIRIKSNSRRGGTVDGVYVRNIEVGQVKEAVLKVNMFYAIYGDQTGNFIPKVKNIFLENITVKNGGKYGVWAKGYESDPIENIILKDVIIEKVENKYLLENVKNIQFINTKINGTLVESPNN
ncbi:glycoside hydrolase family 28 protein [Flavobacterium capsici]|uniref:Glycoside hydrolase family 28 protein n=1 Tax=Flavobacterium capsici TaxID=3075618 RepID=A0AA96J481_9FLAO|nr:MULTISPECIES: glycoside hydrolase family 28 protein [unclassified Flavobacterium]WNM17746.1 glycoside hydrolase family 28 protein [Flavobacterium sp. PMR2A8]WNM21799.1 glycoside hydrolase family 28 protein [Flavobacterium sp. PMTSA4]